MGKKLIDQVGIRVGAFESVSPEKVVLFGFGIYEGKHVPADSHPIFKVLGGNPRIRLDSGEIVWGFECWWDAEEEAKDIIKKAQEQGTKIVNITPREYRNFI